MRRGGGPARTGGADAGANRLTTSGIISPTELFTKRLRLRPPTLGDFEHSFALWSDPVVTRFIGGRPHTKEEVWARLLRYIGHWHALGFGYWIAQRRDDGAYVGEVALGDYRRDMAPPLDAVPEIGWVLAPPAYGQGLAREAAEAVLAWRDQALPLGDTVCIIAPDNAASLRIAAGLGFREVVRAIYRGSETVVLRRPASA